MKAKTKKKKSILLRLLILGVCVYMIITLAGLWNTLNKTVAERDKLKEDYATESNDIDEMKSLLENGSDSQIIIKAARERLGYVFPGEIIFQDISGN